MTVKDLKDALEDVPDHVEVTVLIDSWESETRNAWLAGYSSEKNDEGELVEEFNISC